MWSKIVVSKRFVRGGYPKVHTFPAGICQTVINAIWHAFLVLPPDKCQDKNDMSIFMIPLTQCTVIKFASML